MIESITDPEELNRLATDFIAQAAPTVVTEYPESNEVYLPGGYLTTDNSVLKHAEIRELNGADEEAIAKTSTAAKALEVVLSRGLVAIGDIPANNVNLDELLSGDRDAILLGIYAATFGTDVVVKQGCMSCDATNELTVNVLEDITVMELDSPVRDRIIEVPLKTGIAVMTLPNGSTNKKLADADQKSNAEIITDILTSCLVSVNDEPSFGKSTALNLSISDREVLITELFNKVPGPRLAEVSKACKACGAKLSVSLSLASLFRV